MTSNRSQKLSAVLSQTLKRISDSCKINEECDTLEQVPPAPGRAHDQHDEMVAQGLANEGVKYEKHNRYCNQFPFDCNLVRLKSTAYINASWIKLSNLQDISYIITMGPLHPSSFSGSQRSDYGQSSVPDTCVDMWHMIWELEMDLIVMMCSLGPGYQGCSTYFPLGENETVSFGEFQIKCVKLELVNEVYAKRSFTIVRGSEPARNVIHFQFLKWPNYGVPQNLDHLAKFVREVDEAVKTRRDGKELKAVVHCSGGLGRSGTFLTVLASLERMRRVEDVDKEFPKGEIDLVPMVTEMRAQRHPWMLEGEAQYTVAYKTLIKVAEDMIKEEKL